MIEKIGFVYDEYEMTIRYDLVDYFYQHPQLIGLDINKTCNRNFFQQIEYHGVLFTLCFVDGTHLCVDEKTIVQALSTIYDIPFDKMFADTAAEIVYLFTLKGIDNE